MEAAIEAARLRYPPPWRIGWWRFGDGSWGVEATRRIRYARHERIVVAVGNHEPAAGSP